MKVKVKVKMKKISLLFSIFLLFLLTSVALADTTVLKTSEGIEGGFYTITFALTADGTGGAVSAEVLNFSTLLQRGTWYFYLLEEIPGTGAAAPGAHDNTFTDRYGSTVLVATGATSANTFVNAAEDMPNYWAATGNLTLSVDDIGASNTTVLRLIFCPN